MKLVGIIGTAVLSMTLGAVAPVYAQQEQHDQQEEQKNKPEEQKAKPAQEEKKAEPEKSAKQEEKPAVQQEKNTKQEEKNTQQEQKNTQQQEKNNAQQEKNKQQAQHTGAGRIPEDRYKAHFGNDHRFRVSQTDYRSHHFQYSGYSFVFVDPWPSNWLYTEDVYVVDINGVYYLCNPMYPGVNLTLSFTL